MINLINSFHHSMIPFDFIMIPYDHIMIPRVHIITTNHFQYLRKTSFRNYLEFHPKIIQRVIQNS